MTYQHVQIFPEVLCHESEKRKKGPTEAVKACVAIVWVPSGFHAREALWTSSVRVSNRKKKKD